jgi:hypothetical protein
MSEEVETITFSAEAERQLVKAFEQLDKLRARFVKQKGRLAFMFSHTHDIPYNGLERGLLQKLYAFALIDYFPMYSSKIYATPTEQENDNEGPYFTSGAV